MEFVEGMFQPYQVLIRRESPETTYPLSFAPAIITRTRTPEEKVETMQKIAEQHVKLYHKNVKSNYTFKIFYIYIYIYRIHTQRWI